MQRSSALKREEAIGYEVSGISFACDTCRFWAETPIDESAGHLAKSEIARRLQGCLISRGLRSAMVNSFVVLCKRKWNSSAMGGNSCTNRVSNLGQQIASGIPYRHAGSLTVQGHELRLAVAEGQDAGLGWHSQMPISYISATASHPPRRHASRWPYLVQQFELGDDDWLERRSVSWSSRNARFGPPWQRGLGREGA